MLTLIFFLSFFFFFFFLPLFLSILSFLLCFHTRIGQLTRLQYIDLSANALASLPETLVNLAELQFLDLSSNKFKRMQPFLGHMDSLQKLITTNNSISNIPKEYLEVKKIAENNNKREYIKILYQLKESVINHLLCLFYINTLFIK